MKGRVLRSTGSWYLVQTESGDEISCRIKGKFRLDGLKSTNPLAVGDEVDLEEEAGLETGMIHKIFPRKNYIVRQSPRKKHHIHIIAANLDQAVLLVTFSKPRTSLGFVDRFIMACEMFHIPVVIVFNKLDAYTKKDWEKFEEAFSLYSNLGYECIGVSALEGDNMEEAEAMFKGKTSLIAGHSGVGKSTLLNALHPELELRTNEISDSSGKGMHTTTFSEMFELWKGTFLIDTPGIKEFGLVHIEPEEVAHYFTEMKAMLGDCHFNDCKHRNEPGCKIKEAFVEGDIAESRYLNYLNVLDSIEEINYWERK